MVIEDIAKPRTIVIVGNTVILNASAGKETDQVDIAAIDLRPLGLKIFGNDHDGLHFGNNIFLSNEMTNVKAAFGASA
jgi:hypothetical protein